MMQLFIGNLGTTEIVLILLIVLLLFGGKKIPEMMKGLGKGVKSFKDGMNAIDDDKKDDKKEEIKEDDKKTE
ncbi:MAG: twin-arginine translocase TatA/TatE family subunit [Rikenellaceae bacterium]